MALTVFYTPRWRAIDANGNPMNGAVLKFFEAGSSTPLPVYADVDGDTELGVEVESDAFGLFVEIFMLPQAYKVELYTSADVLVWTADDFFPPQAASSANVDVEGTAGVTFAAGELAYLSDGSGGLNPGQWYKADADLVYASQTPQVAFAVAAIAIGESGLFRTAGKVTGLSGLTPGAGYFATGTAGAIATTPGTFQRYVGQAESTTVLVVETNPPAGLGITDVVDGRLTLTTAVPVTTSDVTAATTVYFTPYIGSRVSLFTGALWVELNFTEMSIAVPATTSQMYDVFLDFNDGTPQLALTAWTNDTTRATALVRLNGVLVKTGDTQQRYLGSFRTTAVLGQTEDSVTKRFLWNYYNRVARAVTVFDASNTWVYDGAVFQQANASTANQVAIVVGVAEDAISLVATSAASHNGGGVLISTGIGLNGVTRGSGSISGVFSSSAAGVQQTATAAWNTVPAAGYNYFTWLELSGSGATTTWIGDNGGTTQQTGLTGMWKS